MVDRALATALVVGVVQGVVEWLPISSEGAVALVLAGGGTDPVLAVQLALFLHAGTAIAATVYYRGEIATQVGALPGWRPGRAFDAGAADLTFYAVATIVSGFVGIAAYVLLVDVVSALAGGAFIAVIGGLLVVTGVVQRVAESVDVAGRDRPDGVDAVLVGVGQGLAILPGISRSGTTASLLLLRGHDGEASLRLSFVLSIPAALGAGALAVLDAGGLPGIAAAPAVAALVTAAVVGYVTVGALMRVVQRLPFSMVCIGLGALAIVGGVTVLA